MVLLARARHLLLPRYTRSRVAAFGTTPPQPPLYDLDASLTLLHGGSGPPSADGAHPRRREITVYVKGFLSKVTKAEFFETWSTSHAALSSRPCSFPSSTAPGGRPLLPTPWSSEHCGYEWTTTGHSFLPSFTIPVPVLTAALALQRARRVGSVMSPPLLAGVVATDFALNAARLLVQYRLALNAAAVDSRAFAAVLRSLRRDHGYEHVRVVAHSLGCLHVILGIGELEDAADKPDEVHLCAPACVESEVAGALERGLTRKVGGGDTGSAGTPLRMDGSESGSGRGGGSVSGRGSESVAGIESRDEAGTHIYYTSKDMVLELMFRIAHLGESAIGSIGLTAAAGEVSEDEEGTVGAEGTVGGVGGTGTAGGVGGAGATATGTAPGTTPAAMAVAAAATVENNGTPRKYPDVFAYDVSDHFAFHDIVHSAYDTTFPAMVYGGTAAVQVVEAGEEEAIHPTDSRGGLS